MLFVRRKVNFAVDYVDYYLWIFIYHVFWELKKNLFVNFLPGYIITTDLNAACLVKTYIYIYKVSYVHSNTSKNMYTKFDDNQLSSFGVKRNRQTYIHICNISDEWCRMCLTYYNSCTLYVIRKWAKL